MGTPWIRTVDLNQAKNLIVSFNSGPRQLTSIFQCQVLEWPLDYGLFQQTALDLGPTFNKLDEETAQFITEQQLSLAVAWLQTATPRFFDAANFEIDILRADHKEDTMLALKVYSWVNAREFRERRHRICRAMLDAGHRGLYQALSIFQRRVNSSGWQAFSLYSTLSAE
jgi:hypothetical protein